MYLRGGEAIVEIDEWRSQIKRGTLAFSLLLMISRGPCYGYEMIARLERRPVLAAGESTVYPLLRRLLREGYLSSDWQASGQGLPPRKYYALTDRGRAYLEAMQREWADLLAAIDEIGGESDHGSEA